MGKRLRFWYCRFGGRAKENGFRPARASGVPRAPGPRTPRNSTSTLSGIAGIPYGVYDVAASEGFVLLACGADTGELACDALRRWWLRLGRRHYEGTPRLLVLADAGGSNGYRVPLFRYGLCGLARQGGVSLRAAHLPPYCSKYNPIDHRLFCHLARSVGGLLGRSVEAFRDALARTTTTTGLRVIVETACRFYCAGIKAPNEFLANEPIVRDLLLPTLNYTAPAL